MENPVRCKRIIGGKTYNTETSTLLGDFEDDFYIEMLYKTRHGAFFLYSENQIEGNIGIQPYEPSEAQKWMEEYSSPERLEAEFGQMPDAGDDEARFTLRIPESLRKRVAVIADANGQSLNAWILRCLERCASAKDKEALS
jgi:predicted HicB family RNase H-like nuclease